MENIIQEIISTNLSSLRGTDCYNSFDGFSSDKWHNANETHSFRNGNSVYLLVDTGTFVHNCKSSVAITDQGVSFAWGDFLDGFSHTEATWGNFEEMELRLSDSITYVSWIEDGERCWGMVIYDDSQKKYLTKLFKIVNEINDKVGSEMSLLIDKLNELLESEDTDQLIPHINKMLLLPYFDEFQLRQLLLQSHIQRGDYETAFKCISDIYQLVSSTFGNDSSSWNEAQKRYYSLILGMAATCEKESGNYYQAIFTVTNSESFSTDYSSSVNELRKDCYETYKCNFFNIPVSDRKVVFVSNQFTANMPSQFLFLHGQDLPDIKFEMNQPQNNELYIVHPFKEDVYYHIGKFDEIMFQDKLMELNLILQSLGAKSIRLMKMESNKEKTNRTEKQSGKGSVSGLINSAEASAKLEDERSSDTMMQRKMVSEQYFEPDQPPHLPADLFWFNHEIVWQKLADQRLHGNITKSIISMSSQSSEFLTSTERMEILAEFKIFILNIKGSYESYGYLDKFLEEVNEWSIEVEFAPKTQLKNTDEKHSIGEVDRGLNNEKDFEEFILDCLDDGNITGDERRLIERRRAKLNITEERAKQIEEQVIKYGNANESEREYLEELDFCLSSGGLVSEDERRILERLRIKLQISEERAKQLEERINRT